jgi:RNA polymerase sigma-70 factor (ECF subfamily)
LLDPAAGPDAKASFPTTRWSRVVAAADPEAPEARSALGALCEAYWYPIYAFIRRHGHGPVDALDLTQDYFVRLLGSGLLAAADRGRGRFRSFLRTDCAYFLADERDRRLALKRGGGRRPLSIDAAGAEGRYRLEPADPLTPDRLFDRAWALALVERAMELLAREQADAGRGAAFEQLRVVLTDGPRTISYATLAERLGTTEAAIQQAIRRLRRRYRDILRAEIASTLDDPTEEAIGLEIRDLFAALSR